MTKHLHGSRSAVAERPRRVEGQLRRAVAMVEEGCVCLGHAVDKTGASRRASVQASKQGAEHL